MKKHLFFFLLLFLLNACKGPDNISLFDQEASYIYFGYPNPDALDRERFVDSIYYNFALDERLSLDEKVIAVPVRISGNSRPTKRIYALNIAPESSFSADLITLSNPVIAGSKYVDTLYITIKRGKELSRKTQKLVLALASNEGFKLGNVYNNHLKVTFEDNLVEPLWWDTWRDEFGPFYKEVFQKWMQIYYLGADQSPDLQEGTPGPVYYWNNMPNSASALWYPVTFMYITVLKKYFEDNVVFPDGDTSKPRILLP